MITDYEYITIQDPQAWYGIMWIWAVALAIVLLITILYTIFATKRTSDGYIFRTLIPLFIIVVTSAIPMGILRTIDKDSTNEQIEAQLNEQFAKADYDDDGGFLATTDEDVQVRGALIPANANGAYKRYAVVYVAVKQPGEQ